MAKWTVDPGKWAESKSNLIRDLRATFAFMIYSSVVKKTPVDTGRARGNWIISVGSQVKAKLQRLDKSKYGAEPSSAVRSTEQSKLDTAKEDETIYISNNLDYIQSLEYGRSRQAPNGMVGVTLANADSYLRKALSLVTGRHR